MAKFIHILAASVGSGLVLGASIRLGEAIGSSGRKTNRRQTKERQTREMDPFLAARLDRLEERVRTSPANEMQAALAGVTALIERQQTEIESIRHQAGRAATFDAAGETGAQLREDLHRQLSDELDQRLAVVEEKLHLSLSAANREAVNTMLASIDTRVTPRIARLENEITGQATALAELRDCSLQSERSILRLLTVLERTVNPGAAGKEKLSVVTGRGQDEPGGSGMRRPA